MDDKAGPSDSGSERGELGFPPYKAIRDVSFRFRSADLRVMIFSRRVAYSSHSPGCTSGGGVPNIKSRAQKGWERAQGVLRPGSAFEEAWESAEVPTLDSRPELASYWQKVIEHQERRVLTSASMVGLTTSLVW